MCTVRRANRAIASDGNVKNGVFNAITHNFLELTEYCILHVFYTTWTHHARFKEKGTFLVGESTRVTSF